MTDVEMPAGVLAVLRHAQAIGAIGRAPLDEHLQHAQGFGDVIDALLPSPGRLIDVGTGGGIPGLPLWARFVETEVTLLDGRAARIELLEDAVEALELDRVTAICARGETFARDVSNRATFDVVTARGFARPAATAECAAPLLRPGGLLVVSEPPDPRRSEARWDRNVLSELGFSLDLRVARGYHFAALRLVGSCPDQYPRRTGVPEKRPLF